MDGDGAPRRQDWLPEFSVEVDTAGEQIVVRVFGELDMFSVVQLGQATENLVSGGRSVRFDLGGVSFIDCSGLNFFVAAFQRAQRDQGFAFTVTRPQRSVFRAFELATLDRLLPWCDPAP
jgi:anti-anti-sigma factor